MLDHIILAVSGVERSLAFYEAALSRQISDSSCRTRAKTVIPICGNLVMAKGRSSG
jgi:catechol 2,3-dioxygenase-like lactoylglutathione lyase family enzyme